MTSVSERKETSIEATSTKTTSSSQPLVSEETSKDVLVREKAIPELVTPTGRQVGVRHIPGTAMYRIVFVDGKGGELPNRYSGKYTGQHRAKADALAYVTAFWDLSDASKKSKSNNSAVSR